VKVSVCGRGHEQSVGPATRARATAPASRVAATARCPSCVCFVGVPACERGCSFSRPCHGGRCGETAALLLEWNGASSGCVAPQSVVVRTPVRFWLSRVVRGRGACLDCGESPCGTGLLLVRLVLPLRDTRARPPHFLTFHGAVQEASCGAATTPPSPPTDGCGANPGQ